MSDLIDNAITPARRHMLLTSDCRDLSARARVYLWRALGREASRAERGGVVDLIAV